MKIIDLRSDTVTKPSPEMRLAMSNAEVGDDVYAEDPTVNALQVKMAEMLGKESALFTPTGVMANQLAIKSQTEPGNEVIVEEESHIYNYETAAPAMLSHVQLRPIKGERGILFAEQITPAIRSAIYYNPKTVLLCLENTHNKAGGTVYPMERIQALHAIAKENGLKMHLDGARLWNASVKSGIALNNYAKYFDTVSICFSKGLGAPIGSMLVGSRETIERARKFRKIFGGGMRQAGILAAAALYAVEHNVQRLKEDHEKILILAAELKNIEGLFIDPETVQTNILSIDSSKHKNSSAEIIAELSREGVYISSMSSTSLRAVTHLDVSMDDVRQAAGIMKKILS